MALHSIHGETRSVDNLKSQRSGLGTVSIAPVQEGQVVGKVIIKDNQIVLNDGTLDLAIFGFEQGGF